MDLTLSDLLPGLGHAFVILGEARCLALFEERDHATSRVLLGQLLEFLVFVQLAEVAEGSLRNINSSLGQFMIPRRGLTVAPSTRSVFQKGLDLVRLN